MKGYEQKLKYRLITKAVVVAQLVEQSLPIPEVRGLNPVIIKHLYWTLFTVNCIEETKIKEKRPRIPHFFKKNCHGYFEEFCGFLLQHLVTLLPTYLPTIQSVNQVWRVHVRRTRKTEERCSVNISIDWQFANWIKPPFSREMYLYFPRDQLTYRRSRKYFANQLQQNTTHRRCRDDCMACLLFDWFGFSKYKLQIKSNPF